MLSSTVNVMTGLQKFVVTFIATAGSVITVMNSPNFAAAVPIILLLWLSIIMILWINQRHIELKTAAAKAEESAKESRLAELRCQEELHTRDKLLAVVWEKLKQRSGGTRPPVPDLAKIVGEKTAKAIMDAGALVDLNQRTQEIKL